MSNEVPGCAPCGQNQAYASPINGVMIGGNASISHADCEGVTIDLLTMFLNLIQCVRIHKIYNQVNVTNSEIQAFEESLIDWIAKKQVDPATCEHHEKLPLLQSIINRIVTFGQC